MKPSIQLEALVGDRKDLIDFYWDFLWKLGYWPYAYDRQKLVTLGDIAVGADAVEALHVSRLFDVSARSLIRCVIPMVERATAISCFADQYKDRLQAMNESLTALKPYTHRKIDRSADVTSDRGPDLAFTELVIAMTRAEERASAALGSFLSRAAAWSVSAIARSQAVDEENYYEVQRIERRKQADDLVECFPVSHPWRMRAASVEREVRFRRSRATSWPITGDIFHDPVVWPTEEA
jgi:hypothetical protein